MPHSIARQHPGITSSPSQHDASSNQAIPGSHASLNAGKSTDDYEAKRFLAVQCTGHVLAKRWRGPAPLHSYATAQQVEKIRLDDVCHCYRDLVTSC